jgi:hypothetical protein
MITFLHWLAVHTGTVNESGPYYGFWSGFGSDLGELTLVGAIMTSTYHAARANNCEQHRCWRIGRHKTAAGHRVCRKHHPEDHLTAEDIHAAHAEALNA